MTMLARFPLLAVCAMALIVLGGCGADEAGDNGVGPTVAPALSPTATLVSAPSLTRTAPATPPPPTAILAPTATPSPTPTSTPVPTQEVGAPGPMVIIGGAIFGVELARTLEERTKGLSGRESLVPSTGMLFVYEPAVAGGFWMRDMEFPLDFIWIGRGCEVVGLTLNAPAPEPGAPLTDLPIYEIDEVATYTLEVNAGEVERYNIQVGDEVRFSGVAVEGGGC